MITSECLRGARMALKDYGDNEAVLSRKQDLISTKKKKISVDTLCFLVVGCRCCPVRTLR